MKRLIGITVTILAVSVAICLGAMLSLNGLLNRAHGMAVDIRVYAENGDESATREGLVALAAYWDRWRRLFEVITDHDDLRDVKERIIQAQLNFDAGEREQFLSDIALVGEGIDHIREEESLHWSNLLRAGGQCPRTIAAALGRGDFESGSDSKSCIVLSAALFPA